MKRLSAISATILFVMVGCGGNKQSNDDLIIVDVSKSYPKKELILQDLMDVEYIALETTDEFLTQGLVRDVGQEHILVTNRINDGDIFIFDRKTGKGLRKINRQGQGPEEYVRINKIILDEANGEIFVHSEASKKITVYNLYGNFKRVLNFSKEVSYTSVFNYDKDNLICFDMSDYYNIGKKRDSGKSYHVLISKLDGSITREIFIPFETINSPIVTEGDNSVTGYFPTIGTSQGKWILWDVSSDTLYNYVPDGILKPFIVRTPSADAMGTAIFLTMGIITDRYYFIGTIENAFNFERGSGFRDGQLMYDKEENALFDVSVYNGDYAEKRGVAMTAKSINHEIEDASSLDAFRLVEDYKEGKLNDGNLKDIAAKLDEEDNPVIILKKQKK